MNSRKPFRAPCRRGKLSDDRRTSERPLLGPLFASAARIGVSRMSRQCCSAQSWASSHALPAAGGQERALRDAEGRRAPRRLLWRGPNVPALNSCGPLLRLAATSASKRADHIRASKSDRLPRANSGKPKVANRRLSAHISTGLVIRQSRQGEPTARLRKCVFFSGDRQGPFRSKDNHRAGLFQVPAIEFDPVKKEDGYGYCPTDHGFLAE